MDKQLRFVFVAPLLAACLLAAVPGAAQPAAPGAAQPRVPGAAPPAAASAKRSGGGKVGLVIGDVRSDDSRLDSRPKGGFAAGGFVDFPLAGVFSVEPELWVVQKGARVGEQTLKLHYVEAPILGMVKLARGGEIRPFVYGGPVFAFNLSSKAAVIGRPSDEDISGDIRGTDIAVTYGGGFTVDRLMLEARYTQGLSNIASRGPELRTRAFLLVAGFGFP